MLLCVTSATPQLQVVFLQIIQVRNSFFGLFPQPMNAQKEAKNGVSGKCSLINLLHKFMHTDIVAAFLPFRSPAVTLPGLSLQLNAQMKCFEESTTRSFKIQRFE